MGTEWVREGSGEIPAEVAEVVKDVGGFGGIGGVSFGNGIVFEVRCHSVCWSFLGWLGV